MSLDRDSFAFRALLLASLIFMAVGFAFLDEQGNPTAEQQKTVPAPSPEKVGPPKSLWVRTVEDAPGFWTAVLAGLTVVLAGVGVGQVYYLRRADDTTRLAAEAAMKAATAAERTIDAAEAPFLLPTIIGDTITATADGYVASVGLGEMFRFQFRNIGRTPAILIDVDSSPYFTLGLPDPLNDLVLYTGLEKTDIIASNDKSRIYGFGLNDALHTHFFGDRLGSGHTEILSAQIHARYADLFGNEFIGRFCFAYAAGRSEWYCIGGAEYNYRRKVDWPAPLSAQERRKRRPRPQLPEA